MHQNNLITQFHLSIGQFTHSNSLTKLVSLSGAKYLFESMTLSALVRSVPLKTV